jgi:hypothetical protein
LGALGIVTERELIVSKGKLRCMTEIVLLRMRLQFKLNANSYEVLRSHLSPLVEDTTVQGWEECVNAAMMHLLRTVLAKSAKDAASVVQPLKFPSSTSKLQKHLTIVLKRLAAGACLMFFSLSCSLVVLFLFLVILFFCSDIFIFYIFFYFFQGGGLMPSTGSSKTREPFETTSSSSKTVPKV